MSYSTFLASWFAHREGGLRVTGNLVFEQKIRVTGGERTATTVLGLERPPRFAEILVWDSGEVEFGYGAYDGPQWDEHHDVASREDLEQLLSRMVQFAGASDG